MMFAFHNPDNPDWFIDLILATIPALIAGAAAVTAAYVGLKNRQTLREQQAALDTGNGKDIGTTVHGLDQTAEIILAQLHTNTKETLEAQNLAALAIERLDAWIEESQSVHEVILARLPKEDTDA